MVAGPGTGKTRTLVYRIAYLVEHLGADPSRITAVTFTNKAAAEMRQRLTEHFGDKKLVRAMTIGTFHSICLQLLTKWRGGVTLLDENAALSIAEDTIREQNWEGSPRDLLQALSRKKNGLPDPAEIPSALLDAFVRQQNRFGVLDFDDLLLEVLRQFEEYRRTGQANPNAFTHLLVDEFQDINDVQYRLIREWSRNSASLFVIGDPDQSIYGFRGSDSHCFERLSADHPDARSVRLVKNYRSTPEILGCALPLINAAAYGGQRRLEPFRESGTAVGLFPAADSFNEALYIVKEINRLVGGVDMLDSETVASRHKKRHDKARGFSDIAVLYRTHRQAELLEQCLIKEGVPYTVSGREEYLSETPVRTALSFFRLLLHPADIFSLKTCLRTGEYFAPEDAARLAEEYAAGNMTLSRLTILSDSYPPAEDMALLPAFSEQLKTYGPLVKKGKPEELLGSWVRDNSLTGIDSVARLLSAAALHPTMEDLLQVVALGAEPDLTRRSESAVRGDAVSLLTLHGSKGLEFPVVFLCGAQKGKIPYEAPGRDADPEEERRLFYVGLTRAQEELTVLYAGEESPFLRDIPAGLLEKRSDGRAPYGGRQLSLFDGL